MHYFIKLDENGDPIGHPDSAANAKYLFPHLPEGQLPDGWVEAVTVVPPDIGMYEVLEQGPYVMQQGRAVQTWEVRPMTAEEKEAKQQAAKDHWAAHGALSLPSWVWSEEKCDYVSPVPYPDDGNTYAWDEESIQWTVLDNPKAVAP